MGLWSRRKPATPEAQQDWNPLGEAGERPATAADRGIRREVDLLGLRTVTNLGAQGYPIELVHLEVDRITAGISATEEGLVRETITELVPRRRPAKAARASKTKAKPATKSVAALIDDYRPQCAALTDDGAQCRNSARAGSDYCASHRGYQPKTDKGLAKRIEGDAWDPEDTLTDRSSASRADTQPRVRRAPDTKVKRRKVVRPTRAGKKPKSRRRR